LTVVVSRSVMLSKEDPRRRVLYSLLVVFREYESCLLFPLPQRQIDPLPEGSQDLLHTGPAPFCQVHLQTVQRPAAGNRPASDILHLIREGQLLQLPAAVENISPHLLHRIGESNALRRFSRQKDLLVPEHPVFLCLKDEHILFLRPFPVRESIRRCLRHRKSSDLFRQDDLRIRTEAPDDLDLIFPDPVMYLHPSSFSET